MKAQSQVCVLQPFSVSLRHSAYRYMSCINKKFRKIVLFFVADQRSYSIRHESDA